MIDAGDTGSSLASTIVDLTGDSPEVVRQGDYDWESSG
jgi:tRNA A37 threonylcarbamoyladenosine synthetase subunit TsaC/SUA5/YrdC